MIGIDPTSILPLRVVDKVVDAQARFAAVAADWIEDHTGAKYFNWEYHWHHAPYELLSQAFTRDELLQLWMHSVVTSKLDDYLQVNEELTWKVQHALWRYGCSRDYRRFVACHNGLGRLAVNLPGFDVRITHTRSINTAAWAAHGREEGCTGDPATRKSRLIYLDASFGALVLDYIVAAHPLVILRLIEERDAARRALVQPTDETQAPASVQHPPIASYALGQYVTFRFGRDDNWLPGIVTNRHSELNPDGSTRYEIYVSSRLDMPNGEWGSSGGCYFKDCDDAFVSPAVETTAQ